MKQDWIICHDATQGDMAYACECLRCGDVQKVAMPISINCYVALARAFAKQHKHCRQRTKEIGPRIVEAAMAEGVPLNVIEDHFDLEENQHG